MFVESSSLRWHLTQDGDPSKPPLVLLHGFAQSLQSLETLIEPLAENFCCVRVDLPGHGETPIPSDLNWEMLCAELAEAVATVIPGPAHWFGYSQGGRVALVTALRVPQCVRSLVLLGASPGIPDLRERRARLESDNVLALNIRKRGIAWFVDYWESLSMFDSQKLLPADLREKIKRERLACDPEGLALALECYGTGTQPDFLQALRNAESPLLLLAGERDGKFIAGNRMIASGSKSILLREASISNAGHAAHLEQPRETAAIIKEFIFSVEDRFYHD